MFNFVKSSFRRTNDCIILIAPLVIFISLFSWYFNYARVTVNTFPKLSIAMLTCLILISGLFSAWFYLVKKTLVLSDKIFLFDKDRGKELIKILLSFQKGIGKYFLSFLGAIVLSCIFYGSVIQLVDYLVNTFIGRVDLTFINTQNMLVSGSELLESIRNFSQNELIAFNFWYVGQMFGIGIVSFLLIFFIPEIIYKTLNPFKALINSIKKIFKKFLKTILLYIFLTLLYLIISLINSILLQHPIFFAVVLILYYYFIMYAVTSIFTFYEWEFLINE